MPSPFHGIYLSSTALRAFQRAMEVSGNNMANVNTRGYSRQTIELSASEPTTLYSNGAHMLGTGTNISSIARARDSFMDFRMQSALGDLGRSGVLSGTLRGVEGVYGEPRSDGIGDALDKFFNGWSALASNPNDPTARWQLKNAAVTLTTRVRDAYARLNEYEDGAEAGVTSTIDKINQLTEQIGQLNQEIRAQVATGAAPTQLADQRNLLLQDLSKLVNVSSVDHPDGTISVYMSNLPLVQQTTVRPFPTTYDANTQTVTDGTNTYPVRGGELLGNFQSIQHIQRTKADLDTLANTLKTQINAYHTTGVNTAGDTGLNFFADVPPGDPQTGAIDFNLDPVILGDPTKIASGTSGNAGDGGLALTISGLRNTVIPTLGNATFAGFFRDAVAEVSSDAAYYMESETTHDAVVKQIEEQIQSISGVSLDDEMADLVRFQRSYQAAARVLSIMDQTAEELIGMIR